VTENQLHDWLSNQWLPSGPPVCVIEGFSGVGKSSLARALVQNADLPAVFVQAVGGSLSLDDVLFEAAVAFDDVGRPEMAEREDGNLLLGLDDLLRRPAMLVIDDFDELLDVSTGLPPRDLWNLILDVSGRYKNYGRLLLITSRSLPEGPWQESISVKTLTPPDEKAALDLLNQFLSDRNRQGEVPIERRSDVVRWLGRNPRAMQALVACLAEDSLKDLIDLEPDAWEMRNQFVSEKLVQQLEVRFLSRTLDRLATTTLLLLEFLSIYRKTFTRDAIDRVGVDLAKGRTELTQRFILDRHQARFSVNKVSQELARVRLKANPERLKLAHSHAADHFSRHFRAKGQNEFPDKGGEFVEARYHLLQADRERDFEEIASSFRRKLLLYYGRSNRVPADTKSKRELIATLLAVLGNEDNGYPELRHLAARLLVDRQYPGDDVLALRQATLATRESLDPAVWQLRQRLAWAQEGHLALQAATNQALSRLGKQSQTDIYFTSAKLLATAGHVREAVDALNKAIPACEPNRDSFKLYQLLSAILFSVGRHAESCQVLVRYYELHPSAPLNNIKRLLEQAMFCAYGSQDTKFLSSLLERLHADETADETIELPTALCHVLLLYSEGRYDEGCQIKSPPGGHMAFDCMVAFGYLCVGRLRDAADKLRDKQRNVIPALWLMALIDYCNGLDTAACSELESMLGRPVMTGDLPNIIVTTWLDRSNIFEPYPGFYYPVLPSQLTGLNYDLVWSSLADLQYNELLNGIRFPRISPPRTGIVTEYGEAEYETPGVKPSVNVTISPSIVNVAKADGGIGVSGDRYEVGQAGAVGAGATAHDMQFTQFWNQVSPETDLSMLAAELLTLRVAMRERATEPAHDLSVAEVVQAQLAASEGDGPRALSHLARAGQWALGVAGAIGTGVAVAAIKSALGF